MPPKMNNLGPGTLTIGAAVSLKNFSSQVTKLKLKPSVKKDDPTMVLSGEKIAGDRTETWTIEGTLLQDFGTIDSLVEWCFTNRGQEKPFEFVPDNTGASKLTGTLTVEAIEIGGDVGKRQEADFEFEVLTVNLGAHAPA